MPDRMSDDELLRLLEAATPGPWMQGTDRPYDILTKDRTSEDVTPLIACVFVYNTDDPQWRADARLIAHAPALAAEVLALRARKGGTGPADAEISGLVAGWDDLKDNLPSDGHAAAEKLFDYGDKLADALEAQAATITALRAERDQMRAAIQDALGRYQVTHIHEVLRAALAKGTRP